MDDRLYTIGIVGRKHEFCNFAGALAIDTKGESVKMNTVKKVFALVLIAAVVFLGATGCNKKSEKPAGDHPSGEHPSNETVSKDAAAKETPVKETEPNETPAAEHPSGEHPTGEHPK